MCTKIEEENTVVSTHGIYSILKTRLSSENWRSYQDLVSWTQSLKRLEGDTVVMADTKGTL